MKTNRSSIEVPFGVVVFVLGLPGLTESVVAGWPLWIKTMNELARDWSLVIIGLVLIVGTDRMARWFGNLLPGLRRRDAKATQVLLDSVRDANEKLEEKEDGLSSMRLALRVSMAIHARNRIPRIASPGGPRLPFLDIPSQMEVDLVKRELEKLDIGLPEKNEDAVKLVKLIRDGKTERAAGRFPLERKPRPPSPPR